MTVGLHFNTGVVIERFQDYTNPVTGEKGLFLFLKKLYKDGTISKDTFTLQLSEEAGDKFLTWLGLESIEDAAS